MSSLGPTKIETTTELLSKDSFGLYKVSQPTQVLGHKNIHSRHSELFDEEVVGSGAIDFVAKESSVHLSVGTAAGDSAARTSRPAIYVPGKGHEFRMTGTLLSKANVTTEIGLLNDRNGVGYKCESGTTYVFVRSDVSGTIVENKTAQSSWNKDTLDGSGDSNNPSGILLDPEKAQIWSGAYQWLGHGSVYFYINLGGADILVHQIDHANTGTVPYMGTGSLPVRYKILNTSTTASASFMIETCFIVNSYGGDVFLGQQYSVSNNGTLVSLAGGVEDIILAVRLKDTFLPAPDNKMNNSIAKLIDGSVFGSNRQSHLEVKKLTGVQTNGLETWNQVDDSSACEFSTDFRLANITAGPLHEHSVLEDYGAAANKGSSSTGAQAQDFGDENTICSMRHSTGISDIFAIYVRNIEGNNGNYGSILTWKEFE